MDSLRSQQTRHTVEGEIFQHKSLLESHQQRSLERYGNNHDTDDKSESDDNLNENYKMDNKVKRNFCISDDHHLEDNGQEKENDEEEDEDEDENDDDHEDMDTDENVNLLPCEHQYLYHDCECQVPVYSKIKSSKRLRQKKPEGLLGSTMAVSSSGPSGILKQSLDHGDESETGKTQTLLEAQRHLDDMRRKRVFSHYRQYEQWRRRQFTCDPYYFYRPPTLYDYALPYSVTTPSAFRRRRQYQRQYSCAARSSCEDSQDSKDSQVSCHYGHHNLGGHHQRYHNSQTNSTGRHHHHNLNTESTAALLHCANSTTEGHSVSGKIP